MVGLSALSFYSEGGDFTCDTDDDGDGDGTMWYKKVDTNAPLDWRCLGA